MDNLMNAIKNHFKNNEKVKYYHIMFQRRITIF